MSSHRRATPRAFVALTAVALLAGACGGDEPEAGAAAETTVTTVATTTSSASTTTTSTTTTSTTTTSTTSSTTTSILPALDEDTETTTTLDVQDTEPIAPPADTYASEPVIELGTLAIPEIGVEMTMYEGIRLTTLDFGPGHWPGSAMPGQVGNVVVAGHRTSKHRVFRNVDQLEEGDEIVFTDDAGSHTYAVRSIEIVEPTDVWIVDPTPTPTATLFACHPPGSTAQRIVVFADLVTD